MSAETKAHVQQPEPPEQGGNPTRNSPLRSILADPNQRIAEYIDTHFPNVTPNNVSDFGLATTAVGSVMAYRARSLPARIASTAVLTVGAWSDGVDGALARIKAAKNTESPEVPSQKAPETTPAATSERKKFIEKLKELERDGVLRDVFSDRVGESMTAVARTMAAAARRDTLGTLAAYAATITNTLPSVARAQAEEQGVAVPETPLGLGFFGTRGTRAVTGIAGAAFPRLGGFPLQRTLDGITAVSNLVTADQRHRAAMTAVPTEPPLSEEIKAAGTSRKELLKPLATIIFSAETAGLAAGVAYKALKNHRARRANS